MRMSPTLNGSSAIRHFERGDVIEIRDRITFDFYTGLPHIQTRKVVTTLYIQTRKVVTTLYIQTRKVVTTLYIQTRKVVLLLIPCSLEVRWLCTGINMACFIQAHSAVI